MEKNKRTLLQEAIADAKTVRDTALASAKAAMNESLTPHLKEIFASKVQEAEEETEEMDLDEIIKELEEGDLVKEEDESADETESLEAKEVDPDEEIDMENMTAESLESFIKDVVKELTASGEISLEDTEVEDVTDEVSDTEEVSDETEEGDVEEIEEGDEEIDIDELLSEIDEETIDEGKKKKVKDDKIEEAKKEDKMLDKALAEIKALKKDLNESKVFSSKLLYVNKLFKEKNLTEKDKVRILETIDKASTVKEAKLIYEALKGAKYSVKTLIKESRLGSASKAMASSKRNIINVDPQIERMQRLAGI